jgi:acyl-CoA synthetase (AMP-forming)/AMP-acid ligase II
VRERVSAYAYPRLVVLVDDLPRAPSGNVLRRRIDRAPLAARLDPAAHWSERDASGFDR